ncbi:MULTISPECIES: hypothetical protein [unclassified Lysobacter]|uniref:hypothetical protein n=1 Tax=unclassified Lysobacter TaxID=2635362 RepID=UPI001BE534F0|nr:MULTISPECIES: hypothetical protein [unclassified Lysobacter]MBT2749996.1 hypothetical protein [Lysobacter sp. ISL-50]MBT2779150.1 hypothetical protein [Lysobacter sp. ISL-54]MBT2783555.1 hypothetical protein [Lysobacter sp. ISL-52]
MSEHHRNFGAITRSLTKFEVDIHDMLAHDDTAALAREDLEAAGKLSRSCWAVVAMLCGTAGVDLPTEPDWDVILADVNATLGN